ncbi:hypothetical protein [Streptosporangium roseum]|uniref:hypothetical protein n=1 Tax=Streptosporangium roseum TaxID=2001 RepID=UPI0012DE3A2D|nr:hypothetical protein [Streptosporangium roseum]
MDSELSAIIAALTRLDLDASRARLALAAGGMEKDAATITRGDTKNNGAATVVTGEAAIPAPGSCDRFEHIGE